MAKLGYHVGRGLGMPDGSFTVPDYVSLCVQFNWSSSTHLKFASRQQLELLGAGIQEPQ
jgi:hypothetical protein